MTANENSANAPDAARNGRLTFYHPTSGGTGSAARFELRLNRAGEQGYDCMFLELARQAAPASGTGSARQAARFDWQRKITAKLGFGDMCEFLAVLEARKDSAGGERGIYHASKGANTIIAFRKRNDQPGFLLGLSRKNGASDQPEKAHVVLSDMEALGLGHVLRQALFHVAFHDSLAAQASR
ncbi:MAG: hypothetical protein FJ225_12300 [Lentisphaerae bacterium]|nr:hypothetical protein [Lentisphaerota bacterium]